MTQYAAYFEIWNVHPDMEMLASRDVPAMVRDLRNHPSIVIWEMGDEALLYANPFRKMKYADMMYKLVQEADPTRPVVPAGSYSNDLQGIINSYPEKDLEEHVKSRRVISEYPRFSYPNAPYDFHCGRPLWLEYVRRIANGTKPVIFTEFSGGNALPNPALTCEAYKGLFPWKSTPWFPVEIEKHTLLRFGRLVTPEDWRETQAMQAVTLCSLINILRQNTDIISAYSFCALLDYWSILCGVTDIFGNAKLAYHTAQTHLASVFVTALQGSVAMKKNMRFPVIVSNYGPDIEDAVLKINIRDMDGNLCKDETFNDISAAGNVAVSQVAELDPVSLPDGLYTIEHYLYDRDGNQIARTFEMAYIEEKVVEAVENKELASVTERE